MKKKHAPDYAGRFLCIDSHTYYYYQQTSHKRTERRKEKTLHADFFFQQQLPVQYFNKEIKITSTLMYICIL